MSIVDKLRAYNGVMSYLRRFDIPEITSKRSINRFFLKFAKDLDMEKDFAKPITNPNYKGDYDPAIDNAVIIQSNWKLFRTWLNSHYTQKPT